MVLALGLAASVPSHAMAATAAPTAITLRTPNTPQIPSTGTVRIPAIVIDFSDAPATMDPARITTVLTGAGMAEKAPFESLGVFYGRSSYGKLQLESELLGVYRASSARAAIDQGQPGATAKLIADALQSFDASGTDFARFDGDGDGRIDYLIVMWTGPAARTGMWVGSYTVGGSDLVVDGKTLGAYAWVPVPTDRSARTLVHETGHALGLSDLYDAARTLGPDGGVGAFDPMGDGNCDLNALSKIMLGWIRPRIVSGDVTALNLQPTSVAPDAAIVMPGFSASSPYREFYVVQARVRSGNDAAWPYDKTAGLQVWHVDATLAVGGRYAFNNSSTAHKFLSLEEADGLGEIERGEMSGAADLFRTGSSFSAGSMPSSNRYSGVRTGVTLANIKATTAGVTVNASALASAKLRGRQVRLLSPAAARSLAVRRR